MTLPGIQIEAVKTLPYRHLLQAVLKCLDGMSIKDALTQSYEEWNYEIESSQKYKKRLI